MKDGDLIGIGASVLRLSRAQNPPSGAGDGPAASAAIPGADARQAARAAALAAALAAMGGGAYFVSRDTPDPARPQESEPAPDAPKPPPPSSGPGGTAAKVRDEAVARYHDGIRLRDQGDTAGALRAFESALEADPGHAGARQELQVLKQPRAGPERRPREQVAAPTAQARKRQSPGRAAAVRPQDSRPNPAPPAGPPAAKPPETERPPTAVADEATLSRAEQAYVEGRRRMSIGDKEGAIRSWKQVLDLLRDPSNPLYQDAKGKLGEAGEP